MTTVLKSCDLIMKGGVTSGVVYPDAIAEIATAYRLHSIGGTSAGAIAAAMAAAAEYRRQGSPGKDDVAGFDMVRSLGPELAEKLPTLFQPSPDLKRLFDLMLGVQAGKGPRNLILRWIVAIFRAYRPVSWVGLGLGIGTVIAGLASQLWVVTCAGVIAILLLPVAFLWHCTRLAKRLPASEYGICPGIRQPGYTDEAFGEWIADRIDRVAGRTVSRDPLTVGELTAQGMAIAPMTTDITSHRPYQLPLKDPLHYFSEAEFRRIIPERIVSYMVARSAKVEHDDPDAPGDLRVLPVNGGFPVFLVARMSLSFPCLISSVPLWRVDRDRMKYEKGGPKKRLVRCLFTDGGVSSNFPIHFFDNILPRWPTFGIALGELPEGAAADAPRVRLEHMPPDPTALPAQPVGGLASLAFALLNTAKDWQDTLQSQLPGYSERNVHVLLRGDEGGMNLNMKPETVTRLCNLGKEAGAMLVRDFDFDEHRVRRAIASIPKIEEMCSGIARALKTPPAPADYDAVLGAKVSSAYPETTPEWRRDVMVPFIDQLAALAGDRFKDGPGLPPVDAKVRLRATPDRVPLRG